jgi:hypothetical protein
MMMMMIVMITIGPYYLRNKVELNWILLFHIFSFPSPNTCRPTPFVFVLVRQFLFLSRGSPICSALFFKLIFKLVWLTIVSHINEIISQYEWDSKSYQWDTIHTNEIVSHTNEIVSHTNEIVSHTNEIISHTNEIVSRTNEIISHTNEIISHTNELNEIFYFMLALIRFRI